jgi:hypothetical protein
MGMVICLQIPTIFCQLLNVYGVKDDGQTEIQLSYWYLSLAL